MNDIKGFKSLTLNLEDNLIDEENEIILDLEKIEYLKIVYYWL